ncbi:hypothetical protein ACWEX2_07330 [Staphylococcus xylosus]|uniref:hypothetical protein n=1 Tax=Staphylococcus xylosus TaxID=1288 RepID=UPI00115DFB65|nr:hypothetical protein [Staphylococcus xylosus]
MDIYRERFAYFERLLSLQFLSSEYISHKPTKGTEREIFIKFLLTSVLPYSSFSQGILTHGIWQSTQADFIKLKNSAVETGSVYRVKDALIFMEIKSNTKAKDFRDLNIVTKTLKEYNAQILIGMFCFKTKAKEKTIIKIFGIDFDEEIKAYNSYKYNLDKYPYIDFCFSMNLDSEINMETKCYLLDISDNNLTLYKGET